MNTNLNNNFTKAECGDWFKYFNLAKNCILKNEFNQTCEYFEEGFEILKHDPTLDDIIEAILIKKSGNMHSKSQNIKYLQNI